jgi:cholest-4-en-3-one 26-monooxygenase
MPESFDLRTLDVATPEHYERNGYPHREWAYLRKHAPLHWYERPNFDPFWVVTKHADMVWLSKQPERLLNEPRLAVFPNDLVPPEEREVRHLLNMDPPDHAKYRRVASKRFTPRAVQAPITIAVIALMLGVPERDWPLLFRWTNEIIAPQDPEFQREGSAQKTIEGARLEVFAYFHEMAERRRKEPSDDIVSEIANGRVDGRPLPPAELLSYLFLLVVAGNETTRNAMTGGMLAFIEHPGEWKRLQDDEALITPAIEEIVRWTTPVIQFCRTTTQDFTLRGQQIRAGQSLCLFYPSANRDEEVFPDGDVFRIDRQPNDHVAFGRGEHVCLGAHLARLEIRAAFEELRRRLVRAEVAGPVERVRSSFVGGIKRVPLRWELRP